MNIIFLLGITLVMFDAFLPAKPEMFRYPDIYGYHLRVGITRAAKIKLIEDISSLSVQCNDLKVVGGSQVDISEAPYQVGIIISIMTVFTSICGGALVTKKKILTAAHCQNDGVVTAKKFTIVLGSNRLFSGGERIPTETILVHPFWEPTLAENDIAIVSIPEITLTDYIQPIVLPMQADADKTFEQETVFVTGYGATSDNATVMPNQSLSGVLLTIIPNAECRRQFGQWFHSSNICNDGENNKSTCGGDSGGPMAFLNGGRKILIGIVSYGHASGCESGFPAVFTRISSFLCWINLHLQ